MAKSKETAEGGARKLKPKPKHPSVNSKDTSVYPFTETPPDFDFVKQAPLKKRDFATDWQYFTHKSKDGQFKVEVWKTKAEEAKTLGSGKERAKAKRLRKMQAKMAELRAQLEAQGIDVEALLKGEDDGTATAA